MKKPLIALSIVCASALALADIEQWQSNWFTGIGTGVTSISDLKPTNGVWSELTEGTAEITDGALELDLDSGTEARFTVTEDTAEDTGTLQRLTVTGVFTPIAADDLLSDSDMADKGAQVGFAVVSETTETTSDADDTTTSTTAYKYYAWVGAESTEVSASKVGWVALGTANAADATTELTIDLAYWTDEVTATFTIKANGERVSLTTSQLTLIGDAKTAAAANKTIASVSCTGSGTLTAVKGEVQLGVASVGGRKYGTVDEAIGAAGEGASVSVSRTPDGAITKYDEDTTKLTPEDSSKEFIATGSGSSYTIAGTQTKTEILKEITFAGKSEQKSLMNNQSAFRTFLAAHSKNYSAAHTDADKIKADLEAHGDNDLPLWQSYALGIDPAASVKPELAEADKKDTENIILTIPALVPSSGSGANTGSGDFTITYKVGADEVTDLSSITIPMTKTTTYPITISFE